MNERIIPADLIAHQHQASDPAASAWVSANAGAGKTHVLTERVVRLLLGGTDPAKILCLTFTKAAAANMANRVFDRLRGWTALDDVKLDAAIKSTGDWTPDRGLRARARRLFAQALETPGGLKVQTIHGFCTRVLQQFPFEANVAARFTVLEDIQQQQLLEQIRMAVLLEASADPESVTGRALATVTAAATDFAFQIALGEAIDQRDAVMALCDGNGGLARVAQELSQTLGIGTDESAERVEQEFFNATLLPPSDWPALIAALARSSSEGDRAHIERLKAAKALQGRQRLEKYLEIFCTADKRPAPRKNIVTKAIRDRHPEVHERLVAEQNRICALLDRRRAVAIRERTVALLTIAREMIRRYQVEKDRRGLLDYDDLIAKTRNLLDRVDAAWVHYKLDLGMDHVLIDEAQDTSPEQWDIVQRLVAEFSAGAGARGRLQRTIFAVGDDKQSIFSFQGAEPKQFDHMQRTFGHAFTGAQLEWRNVRLNYSFRSGAAVLGAVEHVFQSSDVFRSVTSDELGISPHMPLPNTEHGLVELWPMLEPDDKEPVEAWDSPFDLSSETSPRVKLARRIAAAIRRWIARGDLVGNGPDRRAVRPGDILVLVRQRGPLFEAIIRALKDAHIEVAGADRLILTDHIAVMDLLALADAILLPQDDLALATILKSPLFGLSEDELFTLAWNRRGPLRDALRAQRPDIGARLDEIAASAQRQTPFQFYAELLGAHGLRKAILARIGHEANDTLDEFLNLALDYESRETPSLQGFIAWLRTSSAAIKRDMEIARDEVRVMTVHGAKGLEAPIVVLADTTTHPAGPGYMQPRVLTLANIEAATPGQLVWMPNRNDEVAPVTQARMTATQAAEDEYRRLLYVGMTRAADRLIVCGAVGEQSMPQGCWYQLVERGLEATGALIEVEADYGEGTVRRYQKDPGAALAVTPSRPAEVAPTALPAWLRSDALPAAPVHMLTPSSADARAPWQVSPDRQERRKAMLRGAIMHRLLQSLPDVAVDGRRSAAQNYLGSRAIDFSADERAAMLAQVFKILEDARFAPLFEPGSRAEVPIVGHVTAVSGKRILVNGQIDRLVVMPDSVLIADYKTNRPAPRRIEEIPSGYVRQLALYRALLAKIYPKRAIRAALVWTDIPDLMEISEASLQRAYENVTSA
jgi:ATP-dependent helicase/nuclease subunit A